MAKRYKWQLRKGGRKDVCPNCGHRTFVPYVLTANPDIKAGSEYGRCDRENNCGYIRYPKAAKAPSNVQPIQAKPLQPIRMDWGAVARTLGRSNLFSYAATLVGADEATRAWNAYKVGAWRGFTIFWQIDGKGEVRGGKGIPYGCDGHRLKADNVAHALWLHKCKDFASNTHGDELEQCFFGEHLLPTIKDTKKVAIVESEKTALLMSCINNDFVWLASGGSQGLTERKCQALNGYKVVLYPDNAMYFKWLGIANRYGWQVSQVCERDFTLSKGFDLLDIYEQVNGTPLKKQR